MSKLFRFLESLGKINKKEVDSYLKTLTYKGCKIASQKKSFFFLRRNLFCKQDFLVLVILFASVKRCFVSHMRDFSFLFYLMLFFIVMHRYRPYAPKYVYKMPRKKHKKDYIYQTKPYPCCQSSPPPIHFFEIDNIHTKHF